MPHYDFIAPVPGLEGWIRGGYGHGLPEGLPDRARVLVTKLTGYQNRSAIVEYQGKEFLIVTALLDMGRTWKTASGKVIPESDERVHRWLVKALADLRRDYGERNRKIEIYDMADQERKIADLEWVMRRNGWEVP
jgi:hypothetical protein